MGTGVEWGWVRHKVRWAELKGRHGVEWVGQIQSGRGRLRVGGDGNFDERNTYVLL